MRIPCAVKVALITGLLAVLALGASAAPTPQSQNPQGWSCEIYASGTGRVCTRCIDSQGNWWISCES